VLLLLNLGASAKSLHAFYALAYGGDDIGKFNSKSYSQIADILVKAGADINDTWHSHKQIPLTIARLRKNKYIREYMERLQIA